MIDENLKIHDSSLIVTVLSEEGGGGAIGYVIKVTPSLRGVDHGRFGLYKPPLDHPIHASHSLNGLQFDSRAPFESPAGTLQS